MIENWCKSLDKGGSFGALLTDLSKAFDCLPHDLLVVKLHAYGLDINSARLMYSYLKGRKQCVKIGHVYSSWEEILLEFRKDQYWVHFCSIFLYVIFLTFLTMIKMLQVMQMIIHLILLQTLLKSS